MIWPQVLVTTPAGGEFVSFDPLPVAATRYTPAAGYQLRPATRGREQEEQMSKSIEKALADATAASARNTANMYPNHKAMQKIAAQLEAKAARTK